MPLPCLNGDTRKQYHNVQSLINRYLKEIGTDLDLTIPLTMYCVRLHGQALHEVKVFQCRLLAKEWDMILKVPLEFTLHLWKGR